MPPPPPHHPVSTPFLLSPLSAGIAVGFYGNGETCDGVNRLTYSLRHANRTISGVQKLVGWKWLLIIHHQSAMSISDFPLSLERCRKFPFASPTWPCLPLCWVQVYDSTSALNQTVEDNLQQLEGQYAQHADYLSIVQKLQGQLDELVRQMVEIPFWDNTNVSLDELAVKIELYDWYR